MNVGDPYGKLMADEIWEPECAAISKLPGAISACPAVVGGAVRDLLLDRPIGDLDIATSKPGTAGDLAAAFARARRRRLVEYAHEQTIHRVVARDAPQVDFTDPVGGTREADLRRRDFTINAIAIGLVGDESGRLIDPTGGINDLESKLIRMTSPDVFDDDPLRMLRAFRFSTQLDFRIDDETLQAVSERALGLRKVAGERIQHEMLLMLSPDGVVDRVELMDSIGLLHPLFPELAMQKGMEQNDYHHLDVWEHTIEALRQIERVLALDEEIFQPYTDRIGEYIDFVYPSGHSRRSLIKLATLLHDIAKPHCRIVHDDGRVTFIGHEGRGSDLVREHLTRLRFPMYERDFVCTIIKGHLRPVLLGSDEIQRPKVAYKFFRDFEEVSLAIILMSVADRFSAQGVRITDEINQRHLRTMAYLLDCLYNKADLVVRPPQLIDGATLIHELGIEPGRLVGHLLRRVQEAQVMGEIGTREEALELCRGIVEESP